MSGFGSNNAGTFQPGSAASATSLVELSVSGRNLRDLDVFSKSDPMCVIYIQPFGSTTTTRKKWQELKRTECLKKNLNPDFTEKLQIFLTQLLYVAFMGNPFWLMLLAVTCYYVPLRTC
mgnify:CR=1 FL=1